jgi:hypothetical protein
VVKHGEQDRGLLRTQLAKLKQQMIQEQVCTCVFFSFAFLSQRHGRGLLRTQLARSLPS